MEEQITVMANDEDGDLWNGADYVHHHVPLPLCGLSSLS